MASRKSSAPRARPSWYMRVPHPMHSQRLCHPCTFRCSSASALVPASKFPETGHVTANQLLRDVAAPNLFLRWVDTDAADANAALPLLQFGSSSHFGTELSTSFACSTSRFELGKRPLWLRCRAFCFSPARNHRAEAELMQPAPGFPDQFGFVDNRVGTVWLVRLHQPHEEDGVVIQGALERHLFAGFFIPFQLALLHKEIFCAVPPRYFYGIKALRWNAGVLKHPEPPQQGIAGQEPIPNSSISMTIFSLDRPGQPWNCSPN